MIEKDFPLRLAQLRNEKNISARDMSLSIGQNPGYINTIENGKAFPTMSNFFYICDFLEVTPKEFFDFEVEYPYKIRHLIQLLNSFDDNTLDALITIAEKIKNK